MAYRHLGVASDDRGVVSMTLNRPERHNAFNEEVIAELTQALQLVADDDQARLLVVRGAGPSFSAGADLDWMRRMAGYGEAENRADANALAAMLERLDSLPVPVIARVQGAAIGGGAGLVCCCDMAVASSEAVFAFSEVRLGLIPATISPYVLNAIGARAARRYFLTGERFDAATAQQLGMISAVVDAGALDAAMEQLIGAILVNGPAAVRAAKQLIRDVAGQPVDAALQALTSDRIATMRCSPEGREGISAFLGKRKPDWNGDV